LSRSLSAKAKGQLTKLGGEALGPAREGTNGGPKTLNEDFSFTAWIGTKEATDVELHLDGVRGPRQITHSALIAAVNAG